MKYSSSYINSLSYKAYLELMAKELNENGFRYLGGEYLVSDEPCFQRLFMMQPIEDPKAVDFLRSNGLIDNGRCPRCGAPMSSNKHYWSNPKYPTYFCVCIGCYKTNGNGDGYSLNGGNSISNTGCVVALLLLPLNLIKTFFESIL